MRRSAVRSQECGNCYGNGCWACDMRGSVSTQEDLEDFDDAMERRGEADRDDRFTHPEIFNDD